MKTNTTIMLVAAAIGIVMAGCTESGAGKAVAPTVAATVPSPVASPQQTASKVVEPHAQGVFFDSRAVSEEMQKIAQASRPSAAQLQRVQIVDPAGFGQPVTAMTIEIPSGWVARGQVEWDRNVECLGNNYAMRWSASSPDGLHEVSLLPRLSWQVESAGIVAMNPCPAARMTSAREYLEYMMRSARPMARVVSYRERPDMVAQQQSAGQPSAGTHYEAGELLIGYRLGGQEMRETMIALVTFSAMPGSTQATADTGFSMRARDGMLDFATADRIRTSARIERAWAEQMLAWSRQRVQMLNQQQTASISAWHARRMNEITTAGILERGRIRQETIADIGRINNQIVASRSGTDARIHENFKDTMQEVQPWRDPTSGQQVDLSIHYKHAWQLDDGRQFLTNDANFNPGRDLGIGAHELEPAR